MVNKVLIHFLTKTPIKNVHFLPFEYLPFFDGITHIQYYYNYNVIYTIYYSYTQNIDYIYRSNDSEDRMTVVIISLFIFFRWYPLVPLAKNMRYLFKQVK